MAEKVWVSSNGFQTSLQQALLSKDHRTQCTKLIKAEWPTLKQKASWSPTHEGAP